MRRIVGSFWTALFLLICGTALVLLRPDAHPGHGLSASFYRNQDFRKPAALQGLVVEPEISMAGFPRTANQTNYSVRFEGYFLAPTEGEYQFELDSDDGSRLEIDGRRVVNNWGSHSRRSRRGRVRLDAGAHPLVLAYYQGFGNAFLMLRYQGPGMQEFEKVPRQLLTPVPPGKLDRQAIASARLVRTVLMVLGIALGLLGLVLVLVTRRDRIRQVVLQREQRIAWFRGLLVRKTTQDVLCVLVCLAFYAQTIADRYHRTPFLEGDGPYYANVAISIWYDGDLDQHNQTAGGIFEPGARRVTMYNSNIALGTGNQWYPKHSILMPLLSVPFFALLGGIGFLVFNLVMLLALIVVIRRVAGQFASPGAAAVAAVATGLSPLFYHYAYSYCADILSALLLVGGMGLAFARRGLWAGLVLGLAVWAKLPNLFGLGLAGGMLLLSGDRRVLVRFALGSAASLGLLGAINWIQFGAPWTTGYQRVLVVEHGQVKVSSHMSSFGYPFFKGLELQLFDPLHGLFPTAPASLIAFGGGLGLVFRRPVALGTVLLFMLVTFLFYCKYDFISASTFSNRFLMPVVALSAVPLAVLLDRLIGKKIPEVNPPA